MWAYLGYASYRRLTKVKGEAPLPQGSTSAPDLGKGVQRKESSLTKHEIMKSRTTSVVAGSAALVMLGGVSGAFAAAKITSEDIKDGEVKKADIARDAVAGSELRPGSVGFGKLTDKVEAEIQEDTASGDPHYQGANWGIVDRNTIGNGDAYLRSGPSVAPDVQPPLGVGSLGLRTGSAQDKAAFGNQVDFAGDPLSEVDAVKYSVFTTGENRQTNPENLPNVSAEIDRDSETEGLQYSTLVYAPEAVEAGKWSEVDATEGDRWWLTGAGGTETGCTQASYCTLAEVKEKLPKAQLLTVSLTKGRDSAFSGAVDKLVWDDTTYDFEPLGVTETK